MWLAKILGSVTSAETAAPGSRKNRNRNLSFKKTLTKRNLPGTFLYKN
jgi:hypothetical protein